MCSFLIYVDRFCEKYCLVQVRPAWAHTDLRTGPRSIALDRSSGDLHREYVISSNRAVATYLKRRMLTADVNPCTRKPLRSQPPVRPPARRPPPTAADRPADRPLSQKTTFGEVKAVFGLSRLVLNVSCLKWYVRPRNQQDNINNLKIYPKNFKNKSEPPKKLFNNLRK